MTGQEHTDQGQRMPRLVRLYIVQCLIGFGLSAVFTALLMYFNVAGLRALMMSTQGGFMALFLLFFFNGLVFAGVQFAISIMRMAEPEGGGDGGWRDPLVLHEPVAVPVAVKEKAAGPQRPFQA